MAVDDQNLQCQMFDKSSTTSATRTKFSVNDIGQCTSVKATHETNIDRSMSPIYSLSSTQLSSTSLMVSIVKEYNDVTKENQRQPMISKHIATSSSVTDSTQHRNGSQFKTKILPMKKSSSTPKSSIINFNSNTEESVSMFDENVCINGNLSKSVGMSDFNVLKVLGTGAYGKVIYFINNLI